MKPDSLKWFHLHRLALRRVVQQVAGRHRCLSIQSVVNPMITVSEIFIELITLYYNICYHATLRKTPKTARPSECVVASAYVPYLVL
jgi:hypothetical protein